MSPHHTHMKATYTITIKASGPHHQGHTTGNLEHDADHQLKSLVQKLQSTGHNVHLATFQILDGTPEFIVGTADEKEPISKDGITLETVLTEVREHRIEFQKFVEVPAVTPPVGTEGTGTAPPEPTEAGTTAVPEGREPSSTDAAPDAPDAKENNQAAGNQAYEKRDDKAAKAASRGKKES